MMKKNIQISILSLSILVISISSCSKSTNTGIIQRDCTGTYLELNNKDYLICNPEIAEGYLDGSSLEVEYKLENSCKTDPDAIICALYHESHGFVKITEIK